MNAFVVAWRVSRRLPVSAIRGAAWLIAMYAWLRRAKPSRRLEQNLHKVTGLEGRALRRLSRKGMASAARYYAEVLELPRMTGEVIDARVRMEGFADIEWVFERDNGMVAVLGHSGNWDLIGAYACRNIIGVTSVAEVLEPRSVYDEFVAFREQLGMQILGHEGGSTFRKLLRIATSEHTLVCLLSDRDLSGSGVEVTMWGHRVRVAPGPAALAHGARTVLLPVSVRYERLKGARRRAAKSRWGIVMTFGPVLKPEDFPGSDRVETMTQAWATSLASGIEKHPEDWHMLQRFGWVEA
ncbi:phosphatidylinositol mannoside acyltransferase [Demequina sp. TTPB684]|uniref:phosphatidylinositol mannoside acyltransferase n=1 Tax=unclassified Demequina TaxID=2620311 RepID=UPI001CF55CA1|nr:MULTISPECIES: phosphatidylinositol mannoside acyltransferase [unclassified Demequina]MCB2414086.1 phosphatidylinositol mannoside acyltransferase [Demequina sp. TTPB684]UPU89203.1 phosphatidylinositol mannoside acyltransferase [Demequina sp. TMPB413]